MSLEKRVFLIEKNPKSAGENLAINQICIDLIKNNKYEVIARAYYHKKGVILGNSESYFDIYEDFCNKNQYEIVRRASGGSAILVDPNLVLCYSIFFNCNNENLGKDLTNIYKNITIPLAKNLGKNFSVEGAYYLRTKINGISVPLAGHAMKIHNQEIVQFDGVINRTSFEIEELSKVIKLRELYYYEGKNCIISDCEAFELSGKKINNFDYSKATFLRSEKIELKKVVGLKEIGISDNHFLDVLFNTLECLFGNLNKVNNIKIYKNTINKFHEEIKKDTKGGNRILLGHCFVDLIEPESRIHYGV